MRGRSGLLLVGALMGIAFIAGCGEPRTECSMARSAGTIYGTLVERHGATATFTVERVTANPDAEGEGIAVPEVGRRIAVVYALGEEQFLRVGRRYSVLLYPDGRIDHRGGYFSSVRTADHACSGGTTYADGSAIDTALWRQRVPRRIAGALVVVVVLPLVIIGSSCLRKRRRQRNNDERLRAPGP